MSPSECVSKHIVVLPASQTSGLIRYRPSAHQLPKQIHMVTFPCLRQHICRHHRIFNSLANEFSRWAGRCLIMTISIVSLLSLDGVFAGAPIQRRASARFADTTHIDHASSSHHSIRPTSHVTSQHVPIQSRKLHSVSTCITAHIDAPRTRTERANSPS